MVLKQEKANTKPKKLLFYCLYGEKNHIPKTVGIVLVDSSSRLNQPVRARGILCCLKHR